LRRPLQSFIVLIAIYCAVVFLIPRPDSIKPESWCLLGIFVATIAGLILQPIAGGALVLIAITLAALFGGLTIQRALTGYSDPVVWLVLAAFFISIALLKTGLARRIALLFVRTFGSTSLGVCYSLGLTDFVLAAIIPSSGARSGGVVLPIVRSVAELYGSEPGETARKLGAFLMVGVYQTICVVSATLLTGQASNAVAARMAGQFLHYPITWLSWLRAGIVPGAICMALVPWLVYRLYPPTLKRTPEAPEFARRELAAMGRMATPERIVCAVFAGVCGLWIFAPLDAAVPALLGSGVLLATGILKWTDVTGERAAWDVFIWYGGLFGSSGARRSRAHRSIRTRHRLRARRIQRHSTFYYRFIDLFLRPLRFCQYYGPQRCDVPRIRRRDAGQRCPAGSRRFLARLFRQPLCRAHELRNHPRAHVFRLRLCSVRRLVENWVRSVTGDDSRLGNGRVRLVEVSRDLVIRDLVNYD
jgi:anion transporter